VLRHNHRSRLSAHQLPAMSRTPIIHRSEDTTGVCGFSNGWGTLPTLAPSQPNGMRANCPQTLGTAPAP
jgi:hypothetical protein